MTVPVNDDARLKPIRFTYRPHRWKRGQFSVRRCHQYGKRIVEGFWLCTSFDPLRCVGQALLAEGVDPDTPLIGRPSGKPEDALRTTVGRAAGGVVDFRGASRS